MKQKIMNYKNLLLWAIIGVLLCVWIALSAGSGFLSRLCTDSSDVGVDGGDDRLRRKWEFIPIPGAVGPESFVFNSVGEGPFTGVSDGRILKWDESDRRWTHFAVTSSDRNGCKGREDEHICGRPLGLRFDQKSGDLYIADAYKGLMVVGPDGGVASVVATEAEGIEFGFTNGLDIDQASGVVYFTDSSSRYQRRSYLSLILTEDKTGRLMKYDPQTKQVTVLLTNLSFPNGVLLSKDGDSILVVETTYCRVLKHSLKTKTTQVFAHLPGFGDNVSQSPRGGYWVGMHSERQRFMEVALSFPWASRLVVKLPVDIMKVYGPVLRWRGRGLAVRVSEGGEVVEVLERVGGERLRSVSDVKEIEGELWIGSVNMPFAIVKKVEN